MALKDPGSFEWKILYGVAGAIDVTQWLIDLIPGWGEASNEVLDPIIGVGFGIYFQVRGISMIQDMRRMASLMGTYFAEAISASVAPAWIIDVWYIHKTAKQAALIQAEIETEENSQEDGPLNRNGLRRPVGIQKPLNRGTTRAPNGGIQSNSRTFGQTKGAEETSFSS
jgi:hypothetical protein